MDDSVIKVLRRNGSWASSKSDLSKGQTDKKLSEKNDEDFSLDKNFGILAEEIKKRMTSKKRSLDTKKSKISSNNDISSSAKKELLPLLKDIEALTIQRENFSKKIDLIDTELGRVKNEIISIKKTYEDNINQLKNNINFFEQSVLLINNIKGDK